MNNAEALQVVLLMEYAERLHELIEDLWPSEEVIQQMPVECQQALLDFRLSRIEFQERTKKVRGFING